MRDASNQVTRSAPADTITRMQPRTLILRTAGTNCDSETAHAFQLAGSEPEVMHVNRVLEDAGALDRFQILAIPGGFSYGDDITAGRIFANQIVHHLRDALRRFVDAGKPIIGICNGFQVLVKTDLLPGPLDGRTGQLCTLTSNDCGRYVDRWVRLAVRSRRCVWTAGLQMLEMPIAHGEGKLVVADEALRRSLWDSDRVALIYARADGSQATGHFPGNPNGSVDDIAGICDATGLVFGLMPHPERYVSSLQHPSRTPRRAPKDGDGIAIFRNAIDHARLAVGAGI